MTEPFELGGLQMIPSSPSNVKKIGGYTYGPHHQAKVQFFEKKGKKLSYFLKQKIAVIQAKSLCVQKNFKKSGIFQYWTAKAPNFILKVNNITKVVLSSRAICYNSLIFWEN